ncbi:hypothetical protein AJ78_03972 [Emergomyces pasteurianus Ep9510]|uniref:Uncharacterized protein n=1 Tax=Emergomyces pasteurianus Ep9510 TaxID=1447872 RepID=A0A1J9PH90_9EURO|nr:hypothetical protein AJ78_03972 [Emergomyces pasteurianus Ep9510]
MSPLETSHLSRKRQLPEHSSERHPKRQQLDQSTSTYWDNLSTIHLTKNALREHDRRNSALEQLRTLHKPANRQHRRLNTRQFQAEQKERLELIRLPEFLRDSSRTQSKDIARLSRLGGPDLSDLKGYPVPMISRTPSSRQKRRAESPPSSSTRDAKTMTKSSSTAYSRNFQQHLIDHSVYPYGYQYPNGRRLEKPRNWKEINEILGHPRASLSPPRFSEEVFENFARADAHASKENAVITTVIPILEGNISDRKRLGGEYPFGNLAPLTDGTLSAAKPDRFYGARPEELNRPIREALGNQIIPSTQHDLPMIPNFFLEAKGPDRSPAVAIRQACYDGALGARGMHALQSYLQDEVTYDHNAYTLTSTYQSGTLRLYATHISKPDDPNSRPEYIMTQVGGWYLSGDIETFRRGATAFRNARDWTKKKREELISKANERFRNAHSQTSSTSQYQPSDMAIILGDSDTSTEPAGNQDAAEWNFAVEDGVPQGNPGNPRNPRTRSSESLRTVGDGASQATDHTTPRLPN